MRGLLPRQESLDDAHAAAAAWAGMLWGFRLFGLCGGGLDGVDRDEWNREQLADTRDVVGAGWAGQQAIVTDAVEALWQHMHQKAADELVGIERHHPVSLATFEAVILPFESDAFVIERDQTAVGDGDAMGIAREIAQYFRGSPEWTFGVDHPVTVTQRRQIGREGSCISECGVLSEELQLSCTMSGGELLQDQSSEQARQHAYVEEEVGSASDPALAIER